VTALGRRAPLRLPKGGTVFHLAAVRNQPGSRLREMREVNVEATLALARQAGERGVARFVHVATALLYGPADDGRARTEADELVENAGNYVASKVDALRGLRRLAREGLPVVTVCPSIVFGPDHPSHPNRVTSEIRRLLRGGRPIWLAGGRQARNLVYVDDAVRGLLAAEERGRTGEEYLLAGEEISPRDLAARVAPGRRGVSIPAGAARAAAGIADLLRGFEAGGGYATGVQTLLREWRFSSAKADRDLAYRPTPWSEGLERTIHWLRSEG
jgi:dihydroflavonol-4-reductase